MTKVRTLLAPRGLKYEEMTDEQIQHQIGYLNDHRANALHIYNEAKEMRDRILKWYDAEMLKIAESRKVAADNLARKDSNHLGMD